ncbi:MAG: hypothetical protein DHS20C02_11240 [Micavibrio sp.]|nr:MAG: hypothetical protein DHS20C02_11240 [Micavibrio sp.]
MVSNTFYELHEPQVEKLDDLIKYVSNLLVHFCHVDKIEKIKNMQGKPVKTLKDLLHESESLEAPFTFDREEEVHKHIGDYTLFFAGVFPEYLKFLETDNMIHHPDHIIDHVKTGRRSYGLVAEFCGATGNPDAILYTNLSQHFDINMHCLNLARKRLDEMGTDPYLQAKTLIID